MKAAKVKGGPVEETLMYNSSTYGKIRIFPPRTEDQAFDLVFVRKNKLSSSLQKISSYSITKRHNF